MRTTIRLPDALLRQAKARAAHDGETLNAYIENAVRLYMHAQQRREARVRVPLPSFKGEGLAPGVSLDSSSALLDAMERDA